MDRPIIQSLLDVDFYKDTMGQLIFHRHAPAPVKLAFRNRHEHIRLADCLDVAELRENFEHIRSLRFAPRELQYLAAVRQYDEPMFKPDYIAFLETFRLPEFHVQARGGDLVMEFFGEWASVTRWETLALQAVAELYGEYQARGANTAELWSEGARRLDGKLDAMSANPSISFSDFGTRRRFSLAWQDYVVSRIAGNPQCRGTSNTWLAMKYGLTPMGTNAHELPMVYSAIYRREDENAQRLVSSQRVIEDWEAEYGLGLSIFLPDTYGSDYFFNKVVTPRMLQTWKGSRHDSGPPKDYGDNRIRMYEAAGIDPRQKWIVFADGLDARLVDELERYFHGRIQTTFGIGTNLTNDLGPAPLSIVVKPVEANGLPVAKLSDNIQKASGNPTELERIRRLTGYTGSFSEACRY